MVFPRYYLPAELQDIECSPHAQCSNYLFFKVNSDVSMSFLLTIMNLLFNMREFNFFSRQDICRQGACLFSVFMKASEILIALLFTLLTNEIE